MNSDGILMRLLVILAVLSPMACTGQERARRLGLMQEGLERWEMKVEGLDRSVLVHAPATAKKTDSPLIFVFHGHGGTAGHAARTFAMQRHWPEAISVYMQGLNTPGHITDREGKRSGWQRRRGDQGDRDIKFFDGVLSRAKENYKVDAERIYATGHSNGGAFTYLLWETRGSIFAAVAPSGAVAADSIRSLKPKPVFHIAGESDPLVRFQWQRRMLDAVRQLNGCSSEGQPWGKHAKLYPSPDRGAPVVEFIHPGGHVFPAEAAPLIVKFFKEHSAKPE